MKNKEVIVPSISNKVMKILPVKLRMIVVAKIKNIK